MSEVDSPPESAEDIGPQDGQEPSAAPKSSPEARINGLMSTLGRRTAERDAARREREQLRQEREELRQQLDSAFVNDAASAMSPTYEDMSEPESQDDGDDTDEDDEPRYTLDEARTVIEEREPTGYVDRNNPARADTSRRAPELVELRRELDAGWSGWQQDIQG